MHCARERRGYRCIGHVRGSQVQVHFLPVGSSSLRTLLLFPSFLRSSSLVQFSFCNFARSREYQRGCSATRLNIDPSFSSINPTHAVATMRVYAR
jgi:hypothetical protein